MDLFQYSLFLLGGRVLLLYRGPLYLPKLILKSPCLESWCQEKVVSKGFEDSEKQRKYGQISKGELRDLFRTLKKVLWETCAKMSADIVFNFPLNSSTVQKMSV